MECLKQVMKQKVFMTWGKGIESRSPTISIGMARGEREKGGHPFRIL